MEHTREHQIAYRFASVEDLDKLVAINIDGETEYKELNQKMFAEMILQRKVLIALCKGEISGLVYWHDSFLRRMNQW